MKSLFFIPIFLFFINLSFAQNVVNFVEEGVEFNLYLTGEFTYKVPNGVSKTTKNYNGQISSVGTVKITYDFSQRISKIGSVAIRFNFTNKIIQVGGLTINYDYSGNLSSTSGQVNSPTNTNSTNTNINSQAGVIPEQTQEEKKYEEERMIATYNRISNMKAEYNAIENKNKPIPNGYHKVNVVYTYTYSTGNSFLLTKTVLVINNKINKVVSDNGILERVNAKGEIILGKGYYNEMEANFQFADFAVSNISQEVYFIEYLKKGEMVEPYDHSGVLVFKSNNKKIVSSKYTIWVFAKHVNEENYAYKYIGEIEGEYYCVFKARPDNYSFLFFVVKSGKNGWRFVKYMTEAIPLTPKGEQKVNVNL